VAEISWLLESGNKVGHRALSGRKSVYSLGQGRNHPDGKVACGLDGAWTTATLDLKYDRAKPCPACVPQQATLGAVPK
jgi:hypothetical protein